MNLIKLMQEECPGRLAAYALLVFLIGNERQKVPEYLYGWHWLGDINF